jgi:hypothetical protein
LWTSGSKYEISRQWLALFRPIALIWTTMESSARWLHEANRRSLDARCLRNKGPEANQEHQNDGAFLLIKPI